MFLKSAITALVSVRATASSMSFMLLATSGDFNGLINLRSVFFSRAALSSNSIPASAVSSATNLVASDAAVILCLPSLGGNSLFTFFRR